MLLFDIEKLTFAEHFNFYKCILILQQFVHLHHMCNLKNNIAHDISIPGRKMYSEQYFIYYKIFLMPKSDL